MSDLTNIVDFVLTVSLNNNNVPQFNYTKGGKAVTGSLAANSAETIRYVLDDDTDMELKFVGAAFATPFDGVIEKVEVSSNGKQLDLIDLDKAPGKTGFRFILSSAKSSLLISSPDPEIVNRGTE
ncbi:DP-EP family protein [Shewanella gelidimarina]|jgi:hypothetical protein|uniref:DP-EP family protein n=1 Tax=Shewanella gelidimarina TaxID=56813 RepID=UPI00200F91B0|nr:DP-EP family protein [Shewanella gelidimarina]MCL1057243.1 DP-EP family protein [Shewanella gelidimarina]